MFDKKTFESQVQQKLQELDVSPSASVWDRIEAQLPPASRRRRGIIWWSTMMVAAVAAGGFFFLNNKTVFDKVNNSTFPVTSPVIISGNQQSAANNHVPGEGGNDRGAADKQAGLAGSEPISGKKNDPGTAGSDIPIYTVPENKGVSEKYSDVNDDLPNEHKVLRHLEKQREAGLKGNNNNIKGDMPSGSRQPAVAGVTTPEKESTTPSQEQPSAPPAEKNNPVIKMLPVTGQEAVIRPAIVERVKYNTSFYVDATIKVPEAPTVSTQTHLRNKKRWTFELSASGGQSTYNTGKVDKLFTSANSPVLNASRLFFTSGNLLYAAPPAPSGVEPGLGFSAGLNARYYVNRRLSLVTGLNYSLLSTRIATGQRSGNRTMVMIDGRSREINEFYASGSAYDYNNNYHFIEIPLLAYFQLNRGRVLPLFINGGLSYSRLLKTSALQYDGQSNIYYKATELVRKDFLNVEAGVSARLFSARKYPVTIGPRIQYGLTNLFNDNLPESSKHSLFIGVKASVPLHF